MSGSHFCFATGNYVYVLYGPTVKGEFPFQSPPFLAFYYISLAFY